MRRAGMSVLSPLGAVIALGLFFAPHAVFAAISYTQDTSSYPYANGITVRIDGDVVYDYVHTTTKDVSVTISVDPGTGCAIPGILVVGGEQYVFTENGEHTFVFTDGCGNSGSSIVTVDIIDKTPPTITVDPYVTAQTNQPLVVTASTNEGVLNATTTTFTQMAHSISLPLMKRGTPQRPPSL